jgi:hypothetical protein
MAWTGNPATGQRPSYRGACFSRQSLENLSGILGVAPGIPLDRTHIQRWHMLPYRTLAGSTRWTRQSISCWRVFTSALNDNALSQSGNGSPSKTTSRSGRWRLVLLRKYMRIRRSLCNRSSLFSMHRIASKLTKSADRARPNSSSEKLTSYCSNTKVRLTSWRKCMAKPM